MVEAAECLAAAISSNTDRASKFARNARQWEDGQGQESWGGGGIEVGVELKGAPGKRSEKSALGAAEMTKTPKKQQRAQARAGRGPGGGGKGEKRLQVCQGCKGGGSAPSGRNTAGQAVVVQSHGGQAGKAVGGAPGRGQSAGQPIAMQGQALQRLHHTNKEGIRS